jgi:CBS domain-containing protein
MGGPVPNFMTVDTQTIDADMSIIDLAQLFLESGFRRYPVVVDNRLVGQISRRDALCVLQQLAVS